MSLPVLPEPDAWVAALTRLKNLSSDASPFYRTGTAFADQFIWPFVRFTKCYYDYVPPEVNAGARGPGYLTSFRFDNEVTGRLHWVAQARERFYRILDMDVGRYSAGDDTRVRFGDTTPSMDYRTYGGEGFGPYHVVHDYHDVEPFSLTWRGVTHRISPGLAGACLDIVPGDPSDPSLDQFADIHVMLPILRRHAK